MKTYIDCIPCFIRQSLKAAQFACLSDKKSEKILRIILRKVSNFPFSSSPPVMGKFIYNIIERYSIKKDYYKKIRAESNLIALRFYAKAKSKIKKARDPLFAALKLASFANIIDFGIRHLDIEKEIKTILDSKISLNKNSRFFQYFAFRNSLKKAKNLLFIGDNAGEIVFDRLLIEEIKSLYPKKDIIFVVKGKPIINDALIQDAKMVGIDKIATIISSGCSAPGTLLDYCSKDFIELFKSADLIISKGQGNFEALSQEKRDIFFLFMVKCEVVSKDIGCNVGDSVLMRMNKCRYKE